MSDARLADLDVLRNRFCLDEELTDAGGGIALSDATPLVTALRPDGSWADVDYTHDALKDWATVLHLRRLRSLARAWRRTDSPLHGNEKLLRAVLLGLDGWYARNPQNPNWWWNQIGAPLLLGDTLLCVKGVCPSSMIARAEPAFRAHEPIHRFTGQNLVWTATVLINHGILTDNPGRVAQGFDLIARETRTLPGEEGIQPDMSFHQHGNLLYSGGYGQGFVANVGRLIALSEGTAYAWAPFLVDRFARFVLDGSRWMVRGRTFDPVATGRELSRQGHSASQFMAGLRHLARVPHTRQAETRAAAAIDPAAGASLVTGNRCFWRSDLMTHHRPAGYLSVRVPSPRVVNADWPCCGGEGRLCHHLADGVTMILCDGDDYRDLFPVWNWRQIPGATVLQAAGDFDPDTLRLAGERPFAGGVSDGREGCMAVDFSRAGLVARKAWFLFDDVMIALGSGISAPSPHPVRTTIDQRRWRGPVRLEGDAAALAEGVYPLGAGSAFWHNCITVRVMDGSGSLRLGPQSGAWSLCGVGSPEPVTLPVLNAGLHHGIRPNGATYAYAVRMGVDENNAFADDPARLTIVRNEPDLQAVWHAGERRGMAVFYKPASVRFPDGQQIGVDLPCALLYQPAEDGRLIITLAQPEQREGMMTLQLDGRKTGSLGVSLPGGDFAGSGVTLEWRA